MNSESSVKITYETLFEILMREKNREELQKLDSDFVDNVVNYLNKKSEFLKRDQQGLSSFIEQGSESVLNEIHNIQKIIKEIYNRREKKIIEMAINLAKSPNMLIDTSNCLDFELELLNDIKKVLIKYRNEILVDAILKRGTKTENKNNIENREKTEKTQTMIQIQKEIDDKNNKEEQRLENKEEYNNEVHEQETKNKIEIKNTKKKIKFIKNIPEIYDSELNAHGPFNEGDIVENLPEELIELLNNQNSIEFVD